jgi:TatD DNase family protein
MIDSHCHLADEAFAGDLAAVVQRAVQAGVSRVLCVLAAGDESEAGAAHRVRELWPVTLFAVGVHPHQAAQFTGRVDDAVETVRRAVISERACAIGEIGLDYHYDFSPRKVQQALFTAQVALARTLDLPIVIHMREAPEDTFAILAEAGGGKIRGVFHCFTGDGAIARAALDLGFYLSFAGIITFPRADTLREVARLVPADRFLVETDSPYLAPVPYRGKRNEPAFVTRVAEEIARVRGLTLDELEAQVARNFQSFLGPNVSHETA